MLLLIDKKTIPLFFGQGDHPLFAITIFVRFMKKALDK